MATILSDVTGATKNMNFEMVSNLWKFSFMYNVRDLFIKMYSFNPVSWIVLEMIIKLESHTLEQFIKENDQVVEAYKNEHFEFFRKVQKKFRNNPEQIENYRVILQRFYSYKIASHILTVKVVWQFFQIVDIICQLSFYRVLMPHEWIAFNTFFIAYFAKVHEFSLFLESKDAEVVEHDKMAMREIDEIVDNYNVIYETVNDVHHFEKAKRFMDVFVDKKKHLMHGYVITPDYMDFNATTSRYLFFMSAFVRKDMYMSALYRELMYFTDHFMDHITELRNLDNYYKAQYDKICAIRLKVLRRDEVKDIPYSLNGEKTVIFKIEHMTYGFGQTVLIKDSSFDIFGDCWTCFYGNSGCGKTTLCNILLKKQSASGCKIMYLEKYAHYTYENIRKSVSHIKPSGDIFHNTIAYNIFYGLADKLTQRQKSRKLLKYFTIFGLQHLIGRELDDIAFLSTGEKQRIKLIRMILQDKPIWIIDETTSNIDNETESTILQHLKDIQVRRHKTVIHISHNLENVKYADKVLTIRNKRVTYQSK